MLQWKNSGESFDFINIWPLDDKCLWYNQTLPKKKFRGRASSDVMKTLKTLHVMMLAVDVNLIVSLF